MPTTFACCTKSDVPVTSFHSATSPSNKSNYSIIAWYTMIFCEILFLFILIWHQKFAVDVCSICIYNSVCSGGAWKWAYFGLDHYSKMNTIYFWWRIFYLNELRGKCKRPRGRAISHEIFLMYYGKGCTNGFIEFEAACGSTSHRIFFLSLLKWN